MESKKSLSVHTAWYTVGNFLIRSISFSLLPLYSNLLTTSEFGDYALLVSMYTIASVVYQSGMQNALSKFYLESKSSEQSGRIFSSIYNSIVIFGLLLTFLSIIFSKNISWLILGTPQHSKLISLVFIALLVETLSFFPLHLLKTKEKSSKVVLCSSASAAINLPLNFLLVYKYRMGIEGIFLAQIISSLALMLTILPSILNEIKMQIDKNLLTKMFLFSLPFMIAGIFSSAVDVSDRFFLNIFTSKNEVGIYSLSYRIAMTMNLFVISFRTAWVPRSLNIYKSQNYSIEFGNIFKKLISVSFIIVLLITLFAPYLFQVKLFGINILNKSYEPGLIILPYVLLGYFFSGLGVFYSLFPFVSSKSHYFLYSDLIALLVNIILNFTLIPLTGMIGAAAATTLAYFSSAFFLFVVSRNKIIIDYPIREIIIIVFSATIFLFVGMIIKDLILDIALIISYLLISIKLSDIRFGSLFKLG